jgi:hypothetical protein
MNKFDIKVLRIEKTAARTDGRQVCITFQIEHGEISFQVPIRVDLSDYDDTEMVQVARSCLSRAFSELAAQSLDWKLSAGELGRLSSMNLRPKPEFELMETGPAPVASSQHRAHGGR